jgi:predicted ATPase with chaperone activity
MTLAGSQATASHPLAPSSIEEAGLSADIVLQLALKTLHFAGELKGSELAARLGLPYHVISPVLDILKVQRQCEIAAGAMLGGASYKYRITDAGRERAGLFLSQNHYVGRAPVPLEQYRRYMKAFKASARPYAQRDRVRRAFSHLVISERVLDQIGPAVNAGHSMFVYGPPGNGKTVISQAIRNLLDGDIAIPYALDVEGSIIRFFDPVSHEEVRSGDDADGLDTGVRRDERWVSCRRPMVTVGGELTLDQLQLRYSPSLGFYRAPLQAIANGGVLVIDDFGRQSCSPRDLLNRWIVPLESRVDFLTLQTGQQFDVPFHVMVVFATNLQPADLLDEAFVRRIRYKIFAESPTVEEFLTIFENCCRERSLAYRRELVMRLLQTCYGPRQIQPRGCHPRDLIDHAMALAEYLGQPQELTAELLDAACDSYFLDERRGAAPAR